jgi:pyridoxal/pyridoxine/pyridoxamine kinase
VRKSAISQGISRLESEEVRKELDPVLGDTVSLLPLENLSHIIASLLFILCLSFELTCLMQTTLIKVPRTMNTLIEAITYQEVSVAMKQTNMTIW